MTTERTHSPQSAPSDLSPDVPPGKENLHFFAGRSYCEAVATVIYITFDGRHDGTCADKEGHGKTIHIPLQAIHPTGRRNAGGEAPYRRGPQSGPGRLCPLLGLPRGGRRPVGERADNHRREPGKRSVSGGPLRRTGAAFQPPGHRPGRPDNGSGHRLRPGRYGVLSVRRMQAGNAGHDAAPGYPLPHHYEQRAERHGRGQSRLPFPFGL